jgi:hypothetical protein
MKKGQAVGIASYGAQELSVREITRALRPTLAFSTVTNRYSFAETTVDLVSIGGTIAAQEGSSGGGIVDERGTLAALITTSSQEGPFLTRDMRAVTPEHIRTSFHTETGRDFDANFSKQSIDSLIAESASTFTALGAKLLRALGR